MLLNKRDSWEISVISSIQEHGIYQLPVHLQGRYKFKNPLIFYLMHLHLKAMTEMTAIDFQVSDKLP